MRSAMFPFRHVLIAALCVSSASAAEAQTLAPPAAREEPGTSEERTKGQKLDLALGVLGAYDDNLAAQGNDVSDVGRQKSGSYGGLTEGVSYARRSRFVQFGANEQSTLRYYPTLATGSTADHAVSGGFAFKSRSTQLHANQSLAYRPFFSILQGLTLFNPGPGDLPPGGTPDDAIVERTALWSASSVGMSQALSRSTSVTASASYDRTSFKEDSTNSTARVLAASVSQKVSRSLSLVAGYGNQEGMYRVPGQQDIVVSIHNIDAGVSFSRALGRTRKTMVGFTTGSAISRDADDRSQFRFIGNARVNREISRTWHATGAYNRGVNFVAGFPQPFFADSFGVDVAGSASPRVDLSFNGGYSKGEMGSSLAFSPVSADSQRYTGSARVRFGLTRTTSISGEYVFYQYAFGGSVALPAGVPRSLHRQGLRFGFDLRLPILGGRSSRDRTGL
jgi:hypothetical protein